MRADEALPRIGTFTAACVLVSNAVGSGIFTTTGFMSRDLGDPLLILVLWAVGGLLALAGALSYSEEEGFVDVPAMATKVSTRVKQSRGVLAWIVVNDPS